MVNEDDENDLPQVNDEERYEALVAKRQERRAVSCKHIYWVGVKPARG
jgi:hypothetical protein